MGALGLGPSFVMSLLFRTSFRMCRPVDVLVDLSASFTPPGSVYAVKLGGLTRLVVRATENQTHLDVLLDHLFDLSG